MTNRGQLPSRPTSTPTSTPTYETLVFRPAHPVTTGSCAYRPATGRTGSGATCTQRSTASTPPRIPRRYRPPSPAVSWTRSTQATTTSARNGDTTGSHLPQDRRRTAAPGGGHRVIAWRGAAARSGAPTRDAKGPACPAGTTRTASAGGTTRPSAGSRAVRSGVARSVPLFRRRVYSDLRLAECTRGG